MKRFYKIVAIMGLVVFAGSILCSCSKNHTHKKEIDDHSQTFGVAKFNKIKFDVYEPDIQISHGTKYQVTIAGEDLKKVKAEVKNQVLTISDAGRKAFAHDDGTYQVIITVPNIKAVKEMIGYSHDGDIYLNDINISKANFHAIYGDVITDGARIQDSKLQLSEGAFKVKNSTMVNSSIRSDDADVIITNSKFKVKAFLNEGDVKIRNSQMLGNSTFKTEDGDFKMINPSKISYNLSIDNPTGSIKFRGNKKLSHFTFVVDNTPTLKVTSKDGDMVID